MSAVGQATAFSDANDYNALQFNIAAALAKVQTLSVVEVISCTNSGGVSAVGTVNVKVLVNLMTGNRTAVPHGTIYNIPYSRLQGGANAVILDPVAGDIGLCGFCSRDISGVKASKGQANPGSQRMFDWADGVYIGGMLNGVPTQYVQFSSAGITLVSPNTITLQATTVAVQGNLTVSGTTVGSGTASFDGTAVHTHVHGGVQSGSSNTGPPV